MTSVREEELPGIERPVPTPGGRWLRKNGKHRDHEVEITSSNGLSVSFRDIGGGTAWGNQNTDMSKVHSVAYEMFLRQYVPALRGNGSTGAQPAFRQRNTPKVLEPELPPMPLTLNGKTLSEDAITMAIEDVSPDLAQSWLDRGGNNRKTTMRRVHRYAGVMRGGKWQLNGEAVKLDRDGRVLDGKHRLMAIVEAGVTIRTLVIRGLPPEIFPDLDIGKNRTPGDIIGIAGYKNRVAIASAARGLILIEASGRYDPPQRLPYEHLYTHHAILEYVQRHPEVEEGVQMAGHIQAAGLSGGSGLLGTLFTLLLRVDAEKAHEFADALASGANLDANSPILRYRNRLIGDKQQRMSSSNADREQLIALGIKAWNFWRRGESIQSLTFHPQRGQGRRAGEAFPVAE